MGHEEVKMTETFVLLSPADVSNSQAEEEKSEILGDFELKDVGIPSQPAKAIDLKNRAPIVPPSHAKKDVPHAPNGAPSMPSLSHSNKGTPSVPHGEPPVPLSRSNKGSPAVPNGAPSIPSPSHSVKEALVVPDISASLPASSPHSKKSKATIVTPGKHHNLLEDQVYPKKTHTTTAATTTQKFEVHHNHIHLGEEKIYTPIKVEGLSTLTHDNICCTVSFLYVPCNTVLS